MGISGPLFTKVLVVINILSSIILLISSLASVINPVIFWPISFLGLAYPILFLANLIFLIYWLIRVSKYAYIPATAILLGWGILINYFGFNFPVKNYLPQVNNLRIMTYNTHNFEDINKPDAFAYKKILNLIKLQNPDIITFEEFNVRASRYRFCDTLTQIMHSKNYYFEPFITTPADSTGLAIFSKFPIINHSVIKLSDEKSDNQGIVADIRSPRGIVRVYCFHLQSIMLNVGDYEIIKHKRYYRKYLGGTIRKFKTAYIKRAQQAVMIKQQTAHCKYPYIFAGDFNDPPNSYTFHVISKGLKNAFREKGSGYGITYNQGLPIFQIDYILTSQQFEVLNYQIVKQKISDHYPVMADLAIK